MEENKAVWAENLSNEMNITLAFALDFEKKTAFEMEIAGSSCYKIYCDGEHTGFGPQRAAHGYGRTSVFFGEAKRLVVEITNLGVKSFCWLKQQPFFACEIKAENKVYTAEDFKCYQIFDRVQKVQRYSYQRGFAETYRMKNDRTGFYLGTEIPDSFKAVNTVNVPMPKMLTSHVDNAKLDVHYPVRTVETGTAKIDESLPVWRERTHTLVGGELEGYTIDEWSESSIDEASKFVYLPNKKAEKNCFEYATYDFGRAITGFTEIKVKTDKPCTLYFIFDELLWHEKGLGENYVAFNRNTCSSVHKWTFEKAGVYSVATFEPYTVRYALVVFTEGVKAEISLRDLENPNAKKFRFTSNNEVINEIVESARNTFAQNAVDFLTDCPSRERSGWLSDSYFSSVAEFVLTGDNQAERAFLENYTMAETGWMPKGLVPMNYPSDNYNDVYIPNWTLWYVLEVIKYAKKYGKDELVRKSESTVRGILDYFKTKENELGLIENLESWVFIEWSAANRGDHVCGVNIPSNMHYAKCLEEAGKFFGDSDMVNKAEKIRNTVKEIAYNGKFFVDNLIRNDKGELVQTNNVTEVCQYYAFWLNCIDKDEYKELHDELFNNLGANRKEGYLPEVEKPNVMYGSYMRIDLLMREGKREEVFDECVKLFSVMAKRTGTLWEHNSITASCDHGFASYCLKWIIYALTGYDVIEEKLTSNSGIGVDCEIDIPKKDGKYITLTVKNNAVSMVK